MARRVLPNHTDLQSLRNLLRCRSKKAKAARWILGYLTRHPHAEDNLEGIARLWILEQRIEEEVALVQDVLDDLEAAGALHKRESRGARARYRLNHDAYNEILNLLDTPQNNA